MRTIPYVRFVVFAGVVTGAAVLLGLTGWPQSDRVLEFSGVILAAILTSSVALLPSTAEDRGMMPPSFVIDFSALLLFGGSAALFVAAAGITARWLADSDRARPLRSRLSNAATVMTATGGSLVRVWRARRHAGALHVAVAGMPIAAAVVAYCFVKSAVGRSHRAALHQTGVQSIVADGTRSGAVRSTSSAPASLSGWSRLSNHGRGTSCRLPQCPLYFAYRAYARLPAPARTRTPPSGDYRIAESGHVRRSTATAG